MTIDCYFNFQCLGNSLNLKSQHNMEVCLFKHLFANDELSIKLFIKDLCRSIKILLDSSKRLLSVCHMEVCSNFLVLAYQCESLHITNFFREYNILYVCYYIQVCGFE